MLVKHPPTPQTCPPRPSTGTADTKAFLAEHSPCSWQPGAEPSVFFPHLALLEFTGKQRPRREAAVKSTRDQFQPDTCPLPSRAQSQKQEPELPAAFLPSQLQKTRVKREESIQLKSREGQSTQAQHRGWRHRFFHPLRGTTKQDFPVVILGMTAALKDAIS